MPGKSGALKVARMSILTVSPSTRRSGVSNSSKSASPVPRTRLDSIAFRADALRSPSASNLRADASMSPHFEDSSSRSISSSV